MAKCTVIRGNVSEVFEVDAGQSVLEALGKLGIDAYAPCGGTGKCGKCKVTVSGAISGITDDEKTLLGEETELRLACYAEVEGDFVVSLPESSMRIQTEGSMSDFDTSPMVVSRSTDGGYEFLFDGKVIDKSESCDNYGVAVDIGTTTVAVYLCDLNKGKVVSVEAFKNPQASHGADVISRIDKIIKSGDNLDVLKNAVIEPINAATARLLAKLDKSIKCLRACVICGNTVMQHIAAGIDPSSIARAPFTTPTLFENGYFSAESVGLKMGVGAVCLFAPCFASYVGGDIALGMISSDLDKCEDNMIFLDVGTNGEIGLSTKNGLYFCSAAAGPAFEGANIECGSAGTDGAVCAVSFDGELHYETVSDSEPTGICGSGLIDAVSIMLELGVIDETGAFADEDDLDENTLKRIISVDGDSAFEITDNVYVTEKDIREVQLAKSAICAGIKTLLHKAKITEDDVSGLVLAGGFGSHINPASACRIGLIPPSLIDKISFRGNTAGMGAVAVLTSSEARKRAGVICGKSEYIELSGDAFFSNEYIEQMMFYSDDC